MPFKVGDSIKVKKGIMCPGNDSLCIAGWQGRIFEIDDDDIVTIRWDSITLQQIPQQYIQQSEEEGLDWTEMYLSSEELEPVSPRDSERTADQVREVMESKSSWLGNGAEGQRILKVIADAEEPVKAWNTHLTQVLTFPFDAEVSEPQDRGPLDCGDKVQVKGICDFDDFYGILVDVTYSRQRLVFPLCDLTVRDKKSSNYRSVNDYCVWFANR